MDHVKTHTYTMTHMWRYHKRHTVFPLHHTWGLEADIMNIATKCGKSPVRSSSRCIFGELGNKTEPLTEPPEKTKVKHCCVKFILRSMKMYLHFYNFSILIVRKQLESIFCV